jgi:hypothetical protein
MSLIKKVLVTGANGYCGNYIIRHLAKAHPNVQIVGMSRRGTPRDAKDEKMDNLSYVEGNCLKPETFEKELQDVDSVIHTVGTLFGTGGPDRTYAALNRDAAVNVAKTLHGYAKDAGSERNFVMLSSAKSLPFSAEYLSRKIEAENFIINECPNIQGTFIRPGLVVDSAHRNWSVPLSYPCDLLWMLNEKVVSKLPGSSAIDFLFPARSTQLSTVHHFASLGALGKRSGMDHVVGLDELNAFEWGEKY